MKTYKRSDNLFEIVMPFGDGIAGFNPEALFDDCPLCQELKKKMECAEVAEWEQGQDPSKER